MIDSSKLPTGRVDVLDDKLLDIDTTIINNYNETNVKIDNVNTELLEIIEGLKSRIQTLESRRYIKEFWQSGSSWYRIWSDGWIEQSFKINSTVDAQTSHTFLKPFKNTDYTLLITIQSTTTKFNGSQPDWITTYTNTGFSYHCDSYAGQPWIYACGY